MCIWALENPRRPSRKKKWKKLEKKSERFPKIHFFVHRQENPKLPKWSNFRPSKSDDFSNSFHFWLTGPCKPVWQFSSIWVNSTRKKWKIQHSNVSCTSPAAHFLEKSWFQANFPNSFLRRLRETKSKCSFQGDRLPSFLRNRVRFYFLGACQRWQFIFSNPDALVSVGEEIGKIQCFGDILKKFDDCVVLAKVFFF